VDLCLSFIANDASIDHPDRRTLTTDEKTAYLAAVKCLQSTPSKSTRQGVKNMFDEFQASHIDLTNQIHQVVRPPTACVIDNS
jgi:hypothetical protein